MNKEIVFKINLLSNTFLKNFIRFCLPFWSNKIYIICNGTNMQYDFGELYVKALRQKMIVSI